MNKTLFAWIVVGGALAGLAGAGAALAMPGVKAILTVDDLPAVVEGANLGEGIIASTLSERGLTMEPLYHGEPILAVAAVMSVLAYFILDFVLPYSNRRADETKRRIEGKTVVTSAAILFMTHLPASRENRRLV